MKKVTKPQAVIRPLTPKGFASYFLVIDGYKTASGNQAFNHAYVTEGSKNFVQCYKTASGNQAFNLWLAHGSQSGLKALQWKIETLFIAKTADLFTTAVFYRLCKKKMRLAQGLQTFGK